VYHIFIDFNFHIKDEMINFVKYFLISLLNFSLQDFRYFHKLQVKQNSFYSLEGIFYLGAHQTYFLKLQ